MGVKVGLPPREIEGVRSPFIRHAIGPRLCNSWIGKPLKRVFVSFRFEP
jgi:hypothetical protein